MPHRRISLDEFKFMVVVEACSDTVGIEVKVQRDIFKRTDTKSRGPGHLESGQSI